MVAARGGAALLPPPPHNEEINVPMDVIVRVGELQCGLVVSCVPRVV